MISPDSTGRALGQRPLRLSGVIEREAQSMAGGASCAPGRQPRCSLAAVGRGKLKRRDLEGRTSSRRVRKDRQSGRETLSRPPVGGFKAARPEQGSSAARFRQNGHAERTASSKRYLKHNHPDVVRTLRDPFHHPRSLWREVADTCPLRTAIAVVFPRRGKMKGGDLIFPLRGKTVAKRPVGGKYGDRAACIPVLSRTNPR